jgi:hypothetical protein
MSNTSLLTNTLNDGLFVTLIHFNESKSLIRILGSTYILKGYCELNRWALMEHLKFWGWNLSYNWVALGGLMVACLPLDPRFADSNPAEDDGFLRVIKIRSTTSFGGEVKPSAPCRRLTACKRTLQAWKRYFVSKIQRPCFSPMSLLLRYEMATAEESGLSRNCAEAAGLPPTTL